MYRAPLLVRVRKGVSSAEQLQAMRLLPSSTAQKVLDMAIDALQTPQRTGALFFIFFLSLIDPFLLNFPFLFGMYRAPLLVRVRKGVSSAEQLQAMRLLPSSTAQKVLDMAIDALQTPQRTARECSDAIKEICLIQNLFGMPFPKPILPPLVVVLVKHGINAKLQSLGMEALRRALDGNNNDQDDGGDTQTVSMDKDILQTALRDLGRTVHNEKALLLFRLLSFIEDRRPNDFVSMCPNGPLVMSKVRLEKINAETGDATFRKLLVGSLLYELHHAKPVWIHRAKKILTETSTLRAHTSSRGKGVFSFVSTASMPSVAEMGGHPASGTFTPLHICEEDFTEIQIASVALFSIIPSVLKSILPSPRTMLDGESGSEVKKTIAESSTSDGSSSDSEEVIGSWEEEQISFVKALAEYIKQCLSQMQHALASGVIDGQSVVPRILFESIGRHLGKIMVEMSRYWTDVPRTPIADHPTIEFSLLAEKMRRAGSSSSIISMTVLNMTEVLCKTASAGSRESMILVKNGLDHLFGPFFESHYEDPRFSRELFAMLLRLLRAGSCIQPVVAEIVLHVPRIFALASLSCDMIGMCLANIVLPLFSANKDDKAPDDFYGHERIVVQKWIALLTFLIPLVSIMAGDLDHFKKTCPEIYRITFGTSSLLDSETEKILDANIHIVDNHILHKEMMDGCNLFRRKYGEDKGDKGDKEEEGEESGAGAWNSFSQILATQLVESLFGLIPSKPLSQWIDVVLFMISKSSLIYHGDIDTQNEIGSHLSSFLKLISLKNPMFLETHVEKLAQLLNVLPAGECDTILEVVSDALAKYSSFFADVECTLFVEALIQLVGKLTSSLPSGSSPIDKMCRTHALQILFAFGVKKVDLRPRIVEGLEALMSDQDKSGEEDLELRDLIVWLLAPCTFSSTFGKEMVH
eukprot:TRINITY_DN5744_c0_g1_i1.p1 TRINITY_DN5744_c0_g1~~TRINITY_DN5744_c0_g1_i1.p1  ORF type:complete len:953 (-),score=237.45 TRINITY_DN5744_c0_g1_i1:8-2773(-)